MEGADAGRTELTAGAASCKEFAVRLRVLVPKGKQADFAARVGVSVSGIKKWLSGDAEPGLTNLVSLSDVAGVTVGWLATGAVGTAGDADAEDLYLDLLMQRARQVGDRQAELAFEEQRRCNAMLNATLRNQAGARVMMQAEPSGPTQPPDEISTDALTGVIVAVDEMIAQRKISIGAEKRAKLIAIVYKQLTRDGGSGDITRRFVSDLLDVAS